MSFFKDIYKQIVKRLKNIIYAQKNNTDNVPESVSGLPPELLMMIVEKLPDVHAVKGLFIVDKATYNFFKPYNSKVTSKYYALKKKEQFYSNLNNLFTWKVRSIPVFAVFFQASIVCFAIGTFFATCAGFKLITPRSLDDTNVVKLIEIPFIFIGVVTTSCIYLPSSIKLLSHYLQKCKYKSFHYERELEKLKESNNEPFNFKS
ncbi:MAG: hypothetical protein BGO90_14245 [Legionella sp. 40-6]|nr:hypothetical protein [Legionella sp.]OJY49556.1 MAG: hypothetical protein BGO90_14245 [Legionella sp. 40-6]